MLVRRKRIKNAYLRVRSAEGPVEVNAPVAMPLEGIARFVLSKEAWIASRRGELAGAQQHAQAGRIDADGQMGPDTPSPYELEEWRAIMERDASPLVEAWAERMGVRPQRLVFRNMRSRWGSCTPATGRICLNLQLAAAPDGCLEYVVVHELCHLIAADHGPRFKAAMDRYLPDWRDRRERLRGTIRR